MKRQSKRNRDYSKDMKEALRRLEWNLERLEIRTKKCMDFLIELNEIRKRISRTIPISLNLVNIYVQDYNSLCKNKSPALTLNIIDEQGSLFALYLVLVFVCVILVVLGYLNRKKIVILLGIESRGK